MYNGARAEKQRIRQEIRMISKGLSPEYRQEASREITRKVLDLPSWKTAKTVMAFRSMPEEPDTRAIIEDAAGAGKAVLLPRCVSPERMIALPFTGWNDLAPGWLNIQEPAVPAEGTEIPAPELILVPCVSASPDGRRLGHGAGYYDRFLAGLRAETVCLCFRRLARADIPVGAADRRMDRVITD